MSNVIAILKITGAYLPPYQGREGDRKAHIVIEESGGLYTLRLRGAPGISARDSIQLAEGGDVTGDGFITPAITIEVEAP